MGVSLKSSPRKMVWQALQRMLERKTLPRDMAPSPIEPDSLPSPGARLPTEVLIPIFEQVKEIWEPSHGCWRAIVLDMPSLWTYIWLQPGGWPQEFLRRSRDCNLRHVVFFPTSGRRKRRRQRDDVKMLAANTHRLESLYLCGDPVHRFFAHDAGPAPHLWNLHLTMCDVSGHSGGSFVIPPTAFAGAVPALRELTLEGIPVPPDSHLLAENLKHLALSREDTLTKPRCPRFLSLLNLLAALRRMPSLSTLTADDILTEPPSASALETALDALPPVWLPQFQCFKLQTPWLVNYRAFMQMVDYDYVPARWDMGTTLTMLEAHQPALLPYDVTTFTVPGEVPPLAALRLFSWHAHAVIVQGWRTLDVESPLGWMGPAFAAELALPDACACDGAGFLCGQLPLQTIEKLALDWRVWGSEKEGNPGNWMPLLQGFVGARCLVVEGFAEPQEVIAALAWTGTDDAGNAFLVCPALCELSVDCVPSKWQWEHDKPSRLFFESLAGALEIRTKYGPALQRLVLKDKVILCVAPEDLDALRRLQLDQFVSSGTEKAGTITSFGSVG